MNDKYAEILSHYRERHLVTDLRWVDNDLACSTVCLPNSAWADEDLAEAAEQLSNMVEHPNPSQPDPDLRAEETPCINGQNVEQNV